MFVLTVFLLGSSVAYAGPDDLQACCRAGGIEFCEDHLRVYGEKTRVSRDPGGWLLEGVYAYTCDGAVAFQGDAVVYLDHAPAPDEIAMPEVPAELVACFLRSCALPPNRCASAPSATGVRTVVSCTGEAPPTAGGTRVIIGSKVILADPVAVNTAPAAPTPAPPAPVSGQNPTMSDPIAALVAGLPPDPTAPCQAATDSARVESRQLVIHADDLRIAGDYPGALARFRAALTVDRCNAYGWLGLGQAAAALARPDLAIRGLKNATMLMPKHYGAWTELGKAYETIGQIPHAVDAYNRALALNSGYAEAQAGARRLGAGP
jgi:hypothetical protein